MASCGQEPTTFVDEYVAPATLITQSCKVAVNTTDGWVQTLYTSGDPVTFPSRAAYLDAMINGSFTSIWTSPVGNLGHCPIYAPRTLKRCHHSSWDGE